MKCHSIEGSKTHQDQILGNVEESDANRQPDTDRQSHSQIDKGQSDRQTYPTEDEHVIFARLILSSPQLRMADADEGLDGRRLLDDSITINTCGTK